MLWVSGYVSVVATVTLGDQRCQHDSGDEHADEDEPGRALVVRVVLTRLVQDFGQRCEHQHARRDYGSRPVNQNRNRALDRQAYMR